MRLINKSIYALALASMMGLWSCSQDEALPGGQTTAKGHPVPVTLTVSRGDAQTRTELSENLATGGLNDVWESGDKLAVYNADGIKAGELTISDGWGTDTGVFSGTVTAETGQHEFNLWYTDPEATGTDEESGKPIYFGDDREGPALVIDLSKMPKYTSVADLSAMDVLSKKVKLNINENKATLVKDEEMVAHLAMARFSLNGIPSGKTGTLTILDNGSSDANRSIVYKERIKLAESDKGYGVSRPQGIIVNNVTSDEDIYLAFIPGTYTLSFHMEFDGVNYDYAFTNPTELKAGVYYNAFTKVEGEEEGKIDGVNIPLQKEILAELHVNAGYVGATPLEIVEYKPFGTDASGNPEAVFPLQNYDYYVTNFGLASAPEGYTFKGWSQVDPNEDEIEKVDSSSITISSYNHKSFWIYAIWEKTETSPNAADMGNWGGGGTNLAPRAVAIGPYFHSYDGGWVNNYNSIMQSGGWCYANENFNGIQDGLVTSKYSSSSDNHKFFQWGRYLGFPEQVGSNALYYPLQPQIDIVGYLGENGAGTPVAFECLGMGTSAFTMKKVNDWSLIYGLVDLSRNKALDYSLPNSNVDWYSRSGNPCPDGYRLPTVEELELLVPSNEGFSGTSYAEVKEYKGKKYAFKWTVNRSATIPYIEVKSVETTLSSVSANNAIFNNAKSIKLYANGILRANNASVLNKKKEGFYWSSESGSNNGGLVSSTSGYGGKGLDIYIDTNAVEIIIGVYPRSYAANILPIYDPTSKGSTIKPIYPYAYLNVENLPTLPE